MSERVSLIAGLLILFASEIFFSLAHLAAIGQFWYLVHKYVVHTFSSFSRCVHQR